MCGRFSLTVNEAELNAYFETAGGEAPYISRYNCAPTQMLAIVRNDSPGKISYHRWGLIPSWAKDPSIGNKMINAKAETIAEKPSFRTPLQRRRCLVPSDGFFEWKVNGDKIPYRIFLKERKLFAYAGLWESWRNPAGDTLNTFTIITTEANSFMQSIHSRMPVILPREKEKTWLKSDNLDELQALLIPCPSEEMEAYAVSRLVNSPMNESPDILKPVG